MKPKPTITRRAALGSLGGAGATMAVLGAGNANGAVPAVVASRLSAAGADTQRLITERVFAISLVDTHEHLVEEKQRLQGPMPPSTPCDDWALLFNQYPNSDLVTAGMPKTDVDQFLSSKVDPLAKWKLLAPYWAAVKNTGYVQAVRITMQQLYGVEDLSAETVAKVQAGYEKTRCAGFYKRILQDLANIESCQVNCVTGDPFRPSDMPTLLMQDISVLGMFAGPNFKQYAPPTGIRVTDLSDWHRVIDWWFEHYAKYAVAVKSGNAYSRDIDYARVPAEKAESMFKRALQEDLISADKRKPLEDHLFWYVVDRATEYELPVKLHTGYYAGQNSMPLARLRANAGSACELCRRGPNTKFVFMHICYPYYEELLAVVKQWANAHVDMCWSWIINPLAAKDYLKKHIVTAPINKLLPFGGDYVAAEPVLGHAIIARQGIAQALCELIAEGWLKPDDALELVEPIMHGNARQLFQLAKKTETLRHADWAVLPPVSS